jgi:cytochrome c oxidase assembly factor CtaG
MAHGAEAWPALTAHGAEAWPALAGLVMTAATYARGWWRLSQRTSLRVGAGRLAAFLGGLALIAVALASPLDALAEQRLSAHMVQHQLLMMLAPPLLWLGAPIVPMLLGLPRLIRRPVAVALASRLGRTIAHVIAHPAFGWMSFTLAFWTWHAPPLYELALGSHAWHHVEHACFFASAMLFWRPVILAWPGRSLWPRWTMIPYLVLADLENTILAAILTFSDRVIYPTYAIVPTGSPSALDDQATAGVIMWVPGSLVFLVAAVWLAIETLDGARTAPGPAAVGAVHRAGRARSS